MRSERFPGSEELSNSADLSTQALLQPAQRHLLHSGLCNSPSTPSSPTSLLTWTCGWVLRLLLC